MSVDVLTSLLEQAGRAPAEPVLTPAFVAGAWLDPQQQTALDRVGPYLGTVVSRARRVEVEEVEDVRRYAIEARRSMAALAPSTRAAVLERAAQLATDYRTALARILALELGKPVKDGAGEIDRVSDTFAICAAEARSIGGEVLPVAGWDRGRGNTAMTFRAPAGIALAITPFNAPANLLAHKLGASFAAGNTTIVKTPPQAPAASAAVVALLLAAGAPAHAVQLLHGDGELGAALCAIHEVAVVSFTGSVASGQAVARAAAGKRLVLELGGNAATIVCADADLAHAAAGCARTGYSNSGQSCISVQRVYVDRRCYEPFLEEFAARVDKLVVGDPLDPDTDVGSMVDAAAADRVLGWCRDAERAGATVRAGGTREGATLRPTIVAGANAQDTIVRQEAFGAAVVVMPFDDFAAVLDTCNDSPFGLQAGLFTHDVRRIVQAWRTLDVGGLIVNGSSNYRLDHVPFGGVKDSGFGRETPRDMVEDYTVVKTVILRDLSIWGAE